MPESNSQSREYERGHTRPEHEGPDLVAALVSAAKTGDEAAMAELDRRYRRMLHGIVRRSMPADLRQRVGSEDVLQSSLIAAFRALPHAEYGNERQFRSWLLTITLRKLRDRVEFHRRLCRESGRDGTAPDDEPPGRKQETPSLILQRAEEKQATLDALEGLSAADKELILWRHYEGFSFAEIAEFRGCSVTTLQRQYVRAVGELRAHLDSFDPERSSSSDDGEVPA